MEKRRENELTDREQQVAELLDGGLSTAEIAQKLEMSKHTVQKHRSMIRLTRGGPPAQTEQES